MDMTCSKLVQVSLLKMTTMRKNVPIKRNLKDKKGTNTRNIRKNSTISSKPKANRRSPAERRRKEKESDIMFNSILEIHYILISQFKKFHIYPIFKIYYSIN